MKVIISNNQNVNISALIVLIVCLFLHYLSQFYALVYQFLRNIAFPERSLGCCTYLEDVMFVYMCGPSFPTPTLDEASPYRNAGFP